MALQSSILSVSVLLLKDYFLPDGGDLNLPVYMKYMIMLSTYPDLTGISEEEHTLVSGMVIIPETDGEIPE